MQPRTVAVAMNKSILTNSREEITPERAAVSDTRHMMAGVDRRNTGGSNMKYLLPASGSQAISQSGFE